jgi:hypothetical protein
MKFSSLRWAFTTDKNLSPCQPKVLFKKLMYNLNCAIWEWASIEQLQRPVNMGKEALDEQWSKVILLELARRDRTGEAEGRGWLFKNR